jgi:hypothetical protein
LALAIQNLSAKPSTMPEESLKEKLLSAFFSLMMLLFVAGIINSIAFTTDVFKFGSGLWMDQVTGVIPTTQVYQTTYGALSMLIAGVSLSYLLSFSSNRHHLGLHVLGHTAAVGRHLRLSQSLPRRHPVDGRQYCRPRNPTLVDSDRCAELVSQPRNLARD